MTVIIHQSGEGADKFTVTSYYNGLAYAFDFGEAGSGLMRTVFLQGDDAAHVREEFNAYETRKPDMPTRNIWLDVLYLYM